MIRPQPTRNGRGPRGSSPDWSSTTSRPGNRPAHRRSIPTLRRLGVLLIAIGFTGSLAGSGQAQAQTQPRSVTRAEAAALARDAGSDPGALRRLQTITEIDGRPVDLRSALAGSDTERSGRVDALAAELGRGAGTPAGAADGGADAARASAQEILGDKKFDEQQLPKPFKGVLEWLADRLRPIGTSISDFFETVIGAILDLPGGPFILSALVAGILVAITSWLINRRSRAFTSNAARDYLVDPSADPAELEQQADAAYGAADHSAAVRLRYEAGLLRLARSERIVLRFDTTATGAARQIDQPVMDSLTQDFEEVVYGDRVATAADSERARSGWNDLLGVRSRR